jgi:electron transfer flavoprotein alpha/beta subunit
MRIAVCVTRVVDPSEAMSFPAGPAALSADGLPHCLNAADRSALEQALRIKDRLPGTVVTVMSLGPPDCEPLLRECLAAGADEAVLLWDSAFEGGDTLATARVLSRAAEQLRAGLVLCGRLATDGATGQTPLQIGELMGLPTVSGVVHLELLDGASGLLVHRRLDRGCRAVIRCPLPAVLALESATGPLRYPRLRDRFQASRAPIEQWGCQRLGLRPEEVGERGSCVRVIEVGPAKPDMRDLFVPDSALSGMERWQAVISGGLAGPAGPSAERPSPVIEGPPKVAAERLLSFLVEEGFV